MYELLKRTHENVIGIRLTDTLTSEDLISLRPYLEEKARETRPLRILFLMEDWHGWDSLSALWEDLKTDLHLNDQVERLAMVGDENWHRWTAMLTKPFAKGTVRYFNRDQFEDAWAWVQGSQND